MANQKAQIHNIKLQTTDLCMNKYNADIKPYEGFRSNNSPFYGNVLSPFYSKTSTSVGTNSYVTPDGTIYKIKDGSLFMDEVEIINLSTSKALTKKTFINSGNDEYFEILGFLENYTDENKPYMLCSDISGYVQVIDIDGNKVSDWAETEDTVTYKPGQKVHFCKRLSNGKIVYSFGTHLFYHQGLESSQAEDTAEFTSPSEEQITASYVILDNGDMVFCARNISTDVNTFKYITSSSNTIQTINNISCTFSDSGSTEVGFTPSSSKLLFNSSGKVLSYGGSAKRTIDSNLRVYHFGRVSSLSGSTLRVIMDNTSYEDIQEDTYSGFDNLDVVHDNYALYAVCGYNSYTTIHEDAVYSERRIPIKIKLGSPYLGFVYEIIDDYIDVKYLLRPAKDETISNGYKVVLYDAINNISDINVGINAAGYYQGGLYSKVSDSFRVLYYGTATGVSTQAVSTTTDDSLVGTLLCTSGEIIDTYPVCYSKNQDSSAPAVEHLYYNDSEGWQVISLSTSTTDYTLSDIGSGYIVINTNEYYNCYDTNSRKLKHFASDYNNRAVFKGSSSASTVTTLGEYLTNSTNFYSSSAQGAGYEILGSPFVSTLYASCTSLFSKDTDKLDTRVIAGYTPDDNNVDIYFGSVESGKNGYHYSYDKTGKYTNEKLVDTYYIDDPVLVPSIFSKFINGFINQGIVTDNGHSYIQVYANTTKPIFGIRLDQQLEGVEASFIVQGQYFVIINNAIYSYNTSGGITSIVNIGNMKLVGYTPYQALLWSDTNRTFYTFMGDNTLSFLVQADEIEDIVNTAYNPNTMSIYIMTDDGIYIFGTNQIIRLDTARYTKCFPLNSGAVFIGDDALYISYNKKDGYRALPIILETEFYGQGNSIKSVNDCVYIRLYGEDMPAGQVKLKCWTMNEGSFKSEEKTFNVTTEMWDKESKTLFLRYQPQYQEAAGFSVHIESPFPIATLQISEQPVTVQNSKYNA